MQVHGIVSGVPVSIVVDSGCSHMLTSACFARRVSITVESSWDAALQVAVANGMVCSFTGTSKVCTKLQQYSADLSCYVVELADTYIDHPW